jgi:hypothetical protein
MMTISHIHANDLVEVYRVIEIDGGLVHLS